MKGLFVNVYRSNPGNCTNGASAKADKILLVGNGVPEVFEAGDAPVYELKFRPMSGVVAVPLGAGSGVMCSGNLLGTSDSRFSEACRALDESWRGWVVPIFDRDESLPFDMTRYYFVKVAYFVNEVLCQVQFAFKYEPSTLMMEAAVEYLVVKVLFSNVEDDNLVISSTSKEICFEAFDEKAEVALDDIRSLSSHEYLCLKRLGICCEDLLETDVFEWMDKRGERDAQVIFAKDGCGTNVFWGMTGWGDLDRAVRYTRNDAYRMRPHTLPKAPTGHQSAFCSLCDLLAPAE